MTMTCITCMLISIFVIFFISLNYFLDKQNQLDDHPMRSHTAEPERHQCPLSDNMTDGKSTLTKYITEEFAVSDSTSFEFIHELLPSEERTALLYHLSYLYLESFPEMERLIRERSIETQKLFGSSEALLMKCAGTSENIVKYLLPSLKVAVEKNKPQLALKFIEKAKEWISDIINDSKDIVKRYDKHYSDLAASSSDITEKNKKKKKQQEQTSEMEELQKIIDGLEAKLRHISKKIEDYEKKIEEKKSEIHKFISSIRGTGFNIYSRIVPFMDSIASYVFKTMRFSPEKDQLRLRTLHADLSKTIESQKSLREDEWDSQNQLIDNLLKMARLQFENGQKPSVTHHGEVQKSLSQIQQILVQLQKFWEKVDYFMDTLKERTFAEEIWIDDLTYVKEEFLKSIDDAKEEWTKFGISCMKTSKTFSVQANQAYRFLEISPSSLSKEEWQKEYESVKEKLENIKPNAVCLTPH